MGTKLWDLAPKVGLITSSVTLPVLQSFESRGILENLRRYTLIFKIMWALIGKGKPPERPDPIDYEKYRPRIEETYGPNKNSPSGFGPPYN